MTDTDNVCCRCGGWGEEGNIGEPYDSADALDTCYHCYGTGKCTCDLSDPNTQEE